MLLGRTLSSLSRDDAFVSNLDLADLAFTRAVPVKTGGPAYDPADLLLGAVGRLDCDTRSKEGKQPVVA